MQPAPPPPTRSDPVSDDYHGTPVADPYRWLENARDPEVLAWTTAQTERTRAALGTLPARERLRARLTALWDFPRESIPTVRGGRAFLQRNDGLQDQPVLLVRDAVDRAGRARVLLNPNTLSVGGTVALTAIAPAPDGQLLAWGTSSGGSDWQELRLRDVERGQDTDDLLRWCKFTSVAWLPDSSGFFYNRFPEPGRVPDNEGNQHSAIWFHCVGDAQASDTLVYQRPDDPELLFSAQVSEDGHWLVITATRGTDPRTQVFVRDLRAADAPVSALLDAEDAKYWFIDSDGERFLFLTDHAAPRGRVIAVDPRDPRPEAWRELIPEPAGSDVLAEVHAAGDTLVAISLRDASQRVWLHARDGTPRMEVALPALGSVEGFSGQPGSADAFLQFTSFLTPSTPYRLDLAGGTLTPLAAPALDFDTAAYETRQVFYASRDGTRVPMFLVHRRGIALDGNHPTLLYGYGGFNIALTPSFAIDRLAWLEAGGVFALANLRGGDEYGEAWHQAGMLERKQNVFDDFIAAAEWLIANGYTRRERLAIDGRSNGGLLVAACMTQRPELYGAVVCEVPVIDMLRYHRFTVGGFWVPEYGNAETDPAHFRFLHAYSPLHNVRPGIAWPATLITSADTDDRVVPAHAKKFAATLQASQAGERPILLRVELDAGHGQGKPTSKVIDERADVYAFLTWALGMDEKPDMGARPSSTV